jgi:hypothetical protein
MPVEGVKRGEGRDLVDYAISAILLNDQIRSPGRHPLFEALLVTLSRDDAAALRRKALLRLGMALKEPCDSICARARLSLTLIRERHIDWLTETIAALAGDCESRSVAERICRLLDLELPGSTAV